MCSIHVKNFGCLFTLIDFIFNTEPYEALKIRGGKTLSSKKQVGDALKLTLQFMNLRTKWMKSTKNRGGGGIAHPTP